MHGIIKNLRDAVITTGTGKDVRDTKMLSGEAKNALHGTNEVKQYETSGGTPKGKLGGANTGS